MDIHSKISNREITFSEERERERTEWIFEFQIAESKQVHTHTKKIRNLKPEPILKSF